MNNSPRYPQRVRNDLRFRELTVLRVERISAGFQRIVLGGEALDGFTSRIYRLLIMCQPFDIKTIK
ncbi:hypothetical protein ACUOFC_45380, partial [Escherichia sp. TWPC-MK]